MEGFGEAGKPGKARKLGRHGKLGKVGEPGEVGKPGRVAANWTYICKLVLKAANGLDWAMLMVTDVLRGKVFFFAAPPSTRRNSPTGQLQTRPMICPRYCPERNNSCRKSCTP